MEKSEANLSFFPPITDFILLGHLKESFLIYKVQYFYSDISCVFAHRSFFPDTRCVFHIFCFRNAFLDYNFKYQFCSIDLVFSLEIRWSLFTHHFLPNPLIFSSLCSLFAFLSRVFTVFSTMPIVSCAPSSFILLPVMFVSVLSPSPLCFCS